jgi:hypothetical protein
MASQRILTSKRSMRNSIAAGTGQKARYDSSAIIASLTLDNTKCPAMLYRYRSHVTHQKLWKLICIEVPVRVNRFNHCTKPGPGTDLPCSFVTVYITDFKILPQVGDIGSSSAC